MLPERSLAAKSAKSVLFEEFNDIDIYIEDTAEGYEKIFKELFSRVFQGQYKVSKVFPLGDRYSVVKEHRKQYSSLTRPTLFIVDGDLFLMQENRLSSERGLFVLPCYCIENILLDINQIYQLLNEECHKVSRDELIHNFNYTQWLEDNYKHLLYLFIEYGISFTLTPELQTVNYPITKLVSSDRGVVDKDKVQKRIKDLGNEVLSKASHEEIDILRRKIESIVPINQDSLFTYVSAKDYLLPLLLTRFRTVTKSKATNINIKLRLAMRCNVELLNESKKFVAA
ncbi:DUF4435 domain-containing protein [Methylomonas sp. 2BW1-5-20]|uniref:DUF4435 domain-containing protein n=1 Tax=Methylomonas sp. 2BW1-5-20 TaxID=3376686 RepID=UPI004050316C